MRKGELPSTTALGVRPVRTALYAAASGEVHGTDGTWMRPASEHGADVHTSHALPGRLAWRASRPRLAPRRILSPSVSQDDLLTQSRWPSPLPPSPPRTCWCERLRTMSLSYMRGSSAWLLAASTTIRQFYLYLLCAPPAESTKTDDGTFIVGTRLLSQILGLNIKILKLALVEINSSWL